MASKRARKNKGVYVHNFDEYSTEQQQWLEEGGQSADEEKRELTLSYFLYTQFCVLYVCLYCVSCLLCCDVLACAYLCVV